MFEKTLIGLKNPKSSCLLFLIWKPRRARDRNTLTAVIYLPNDQVLNYARGTQWNSFDTSLHCWGWLGEGGGLSKSTQGELIFSFFHGSHTWSPSTAPEHSDSANPPLKHCYCSCATCVTSSHDAFSLPNLIFLNSLWQGAQVYQQQVTCFFFFFFPLSLVEMIGWSIRSFFPFIMWVLLKGQSASCCQTDKVSSHRLNTAQSWFTCQTLHKPDPHLDPSRKHTVSHKVFVATSPPIVRCVNQKIHECKINQCQTHCSFQGPHLTAALHFYSRSSAMLCNGCCIT